MTTLRAMPHQLVMAEPMDHGQRWSYRTTHPREVVLDRDYFRACQHMMKVGDDIRYIQVVDDRVKRLVNCLVAYVDPSGGIELYPYDEHEIPDKMAAPAEPEASPKLEYVKSEADAVHRGHGVFDVIDRETKQVLASRLRRDEAYEIARGDRPISGEDTNPI